MMKVVIYDKETNELIALVTSNNECVCRKEVDFMIFGDNAEPILSEGDGVIYFVDNAILYKESKL